MTKSTENKLQNSEQAFSKWKKVSFEKKQKLIEKLAVLLLENKQEFGELITKEMNKPITQSVAEIEKCAGMCSYYASIQNVLETEEVKTEHAVSKIYHEPLGIILGIMPWNFPFWQVLRFAVPSLLAGNTVVLKHASICHRSGDAIDELFKKAGFPESAFLHLKIDHDEVEEVLADPRIKAVSLTGSEEAGRKIAAVAGKNLKKCVLELGGNDAFIVLEDADLDSAAEDAAQARLQNNGQTCVAGKRFIIHEKIYDQFLEKFQHEYRKFQQGDPTDPETNLGLMAREDLAEDLEKQYDKALKNGAETIIPLEKSGEMAFRPGLIKMNSGNPVLQEELFGPLGMVLKVEDDEAALKAANDTMFGLANAVYTKDKDKAIYFAENLESGSVAINQVFRSDWRMPFGGRKNSGYGVELSLYALHEFTVKKSVIGEY